ncbi:MAG: efflux RND transporter periplasmic adaptor subunit [Pseudomonadota bacterium]
MSGSPVLRLLSFAAPVGLAAVVFAFVTSSREAPEQAALGERARTVRVMPLEPVLFVPAVVGYASVEPLRTWNAVAQVQGRIAFVHPGLRVGAMLPAGTEIIRIAREEYELAVREEEANVDAAKAQLRELEIRATNTKRSLEIESRSLQVKQEDLARQEGLLVRGVTSQSALDIVQREVFQQQVAVQELENSIGLYPAEIETQRTQIAVAEARLASARLDLERTSIAMPFRGRIASKEVETTQFVTAGTSLASAGDISAVEVVAQVPQDQFARFVALAVPPGFRPRLSQQGDPGSALGQLGWTATVAVHSGEFDAVWPGQVQRTSDTIDATSRSVGVIVTVDDPYENIEPGVRPPLVKGMFVRVTVEGPSLAEQRVVPRAAVRDGRIFVANAENRLEERSVTVRAVQGDLALIAEGIDFGDRVVVSDVSPAIEGMLLDPVLAADIGQPGSSTTPVAGK